MTLFVRIARTLALALGLAALPTTALAAGDGSWSFKIEGLYIIDFVIFVGLLVWLVRGPARKFIRARYERMTSEMQAASRLKAEADAKLAEVERLFAALSQDIQTIREQFKADGERERARILAETEAQAAKLRAGVEKQIEQETAALKETLSNELVTAVLTATEAKVKAKVDQATHKSLTGAYIDNLEKLDKLATLEKAA
ncbi:MAG: ATP synthase F0 subunit B [Polyangiaceae bacterium]|nr:ATP synthase F0 subunit B [Polyangiaceae bacterium]